jgi:hypothetical protein
MIAEHLDGLASTARGEDLKLAPQQPAEREEHLGLVINDQDGTFAGVAHVITPRTWVTSIPRQSRPAGSGFEQKSLNGSGRLR